MVMGVKEEGGEESWLVHLPVTVACAHVEVSRVDLGMRLTLRCVCALHISPCSPREHVCL